jgi:hypothetical protein
MGTGRQKEIQGTTKEEQCDPLFLDPKYRPMRPGLKITEV